MQMLKVNGNANWSYLGNRPVLLVSFWRFLKHLGDEDCRRASFKCSIYPCDYSSFLTFVLMKKSGPGLGIISGETNVQIITSPQYKRNTHEVTVEGSFGRIKTISENVPSPSNPKTSYLAILAAEALLKKIFSSLKMGT